MRALGLALLIATLVMNTMASFALAAQVPSSTTITSSKNPALTTDPITFTATVTSNGQPVTEGQVQFKIDGQNAGFPAPLNASGKASMTKFGSSIGVGDHNIAADYQGTPSYSPSTASLSQHVDPAGPNIEIWPSTLPIGGVGQPYSVTLSATGGVPPYSFARNGGTFPPGLTLDANGQIGGIPTTQGNYNFNVVATDANGASSGDKVKNIKIDPAPVPTATPQPTPGPQPAPPAPPFSSAPRLTAPDGAVTCTPRIMDMTSHGLPSTQSWYVRASGGSLAIGLYAVSVNVVEESGSITGTLYDGASVLGSATATFPLTFNGDESLASLRAATAAGRIYRLEISAGAATTTSREGRHYRLEIAGAEQSGFNSPGLFNLEGASKDASRWGLNVNGAESLDVTVLQGNIEPARTADLTLLDPSGAVARTATGVALPHAMSVAAAAAGQWTLLVTANEHYAIDKTSGSDRGVYAMWDTAGTGTLDVNVTASSGPVQPVDISITPVGGSAVTYLGVTSLHLTNTAAGEYDVSATTTGSYTVSPATQRMKVTCDGVATAAILETMEEAPTFTVSDTTVDPEGDHDLNSYEYDDGDPTTNNQIATFTITLAAPFHTDVWLFLSTTTSGTATADIDFVWHNSSTTIPAGSTTATVEVEVIGDMEVETDETFELRATNAYGRTATGTATIIDDDGIQLTLDLFTDGIPGVIGGTVVKAQGPLFSGLLEAIADGTILGNTTYAAQKQSPLTLIAVPNEGYRFTGWTGACAVQSAPTCTFEANAGDILIGVTFERVTILLTLVCVGPGSVVMNTVVSCTPDSVTTFAFSSGTPLWLIAVPGTPDTRAVFRGWAAYGCTGSTDACLTVTTTEPLQEVYAFFEEAYDFGGFLAPLRPDRTYRSGSMIPVKFELSKAGEVWSSAIARISAYRLSDGGPDALPTGNDLIPDDQDTFRWADDHYHYNLDTTALGGPGRYLILVDLDDGSTHETTIDLR